MRHLNDKRLCYPGELPAPNPKGETASSPQLCQKNFNAFLQSCMEGGGVDLSCYCRDRGPVRKGWGSAMEEPSGALLPHVRGSCGMCSAGGSPLPEGLEGRWHVSK